MDALVDALTHAPWNYAFLHFADTDWVGHDMFYGGGWGSPKWSNTVAYVDGQLGRILAAVRANPSLADQVAVIVTADHGGGGNYGGYSHTDETQPVNYAIPFFVWGPGIPAGSDLYSLLANRTDPGTNRPSYSAVPQPLRDGDSGNLALALLGLPLIPGSTLVPEVKDLVYPLSVRKSGAAVTISWPTGAEGFVLEANDALAAGEAWRCITNDVSVVGAFKTCTVPDVSSSPRQFFRLRKE